jgi:membrane-associated protease RseP (regulator of RpoE activity)
MQTTTWLRRASGLAVLAVSTLGADVLRADDAAPDQPADDVTLVGSAQDAPAAKVPAAAKDAAAPAEPATPAAPVAPQRPKSIARIAFAAGGYRLGLRLSQVPRPLNEQLDLKGEGMVVARVEPDSPAAKAGIKENDVLLSAGEKSIKSPSDLIEAVAKSDGKELSLKLVRGGKPLTIAATPEKTAEDVVKRHIEWREPRGDHRLDINVEELEEKIREKLRDSGVDMRLQLMQPGKFLVEGEKFMFGARPEFPDDLSVTIRKQGKNPAGLEVKKGDKNWTVKEDELAQLPPEVRGPIESLLGRGPMQFRVVRPEGPPAGIGPPPPGHPDGPAPPPRRAPRARRPGESDGPGQAQDDHGPRGRVGLDGRLDELSRDLNRMREQLDGLRHGLREDREQLHKDREQSRKDREQLKSRRPQSSDDDE